MTETQRTLAVLGGTGHEGSGIAYRAALAGWKVTIGSRDAAKAAAKAEELNALAGSRNITGAGLLEAARAAGTVVLAVPYAAQVSTAEQVRPALEDKVLIDVTVPLKPPKVSLVQLPPEGSCTKALQEKLGSAVRVVSAFQNVSAHALMDRSKPVECDVLVCADDPEAKATTIALVQQMGLIAIDAGPLANSVVAEALTSVLIHLNKTYKVPASGIRITGLK
ncbi:NADPH-dependent F420 reductase [Ramlibacter tataouinensis]|uniref:NADPH-dependent F420 reductase n=1 Tax=Ramlibacter tataouinensis TaxID=94132 RepID=UPI0022F388F9|nr:NADPH-dependent F420 reductase [Ramlibacter tataouinensis]WBY00535.1 NADPH-dependent F420 reductase [Ramlibacter tataouinensis]